MCATGASSAASQFSSSSTPLPNNPASLASLTIPLASIATCPASRAVSSRLRVRWGIADLTSSTWEIALERCERASLKSRNAI
ncbi:hypothetical protein M427DRAFT_58835, partial [Gonapodya prolifera JEL478]